MNLWALHFLFNLALIDCYVDTAQGLCCPTACAVKTRIDVQHADKVLDICVAKYGCLGLTNTTHDFCGC